MTTSTEGKENRDNTIWIDPNGFGEVRIHGESGIGISFCGRMIVKTAESWVSFGGPTIKEALTVQAHPIAPQGETRMTKREFYDRVVAELNLDTRDAFTNLLANACALVDQRDQLEAGLAVATDGITRLERELAAERAKLLQAEHDAARDRLIAADEVSERVELQRELAAAQSATEPNGSSCTHAEAADAVRHATAIREAALPKEPPLSLLASMALRVNHGFGLDDERSQQVQLADMRKVYEEVAGNGFYNPERTEYYRGLVKGSEIAAPFPEPDPLMAGAAGIGGTDALAPTEKEPT